jgi:hypothetical protein
MSTIAIAGHHPVGHQHWQRETLSNHGKPSVINDFIIEENQDVFKIQPSRRSMRSSSTACAIKA